MKSVNVHDAKTRYSRLLAMVERGVQVLSSDGWVARVRVS